MSDEERQVWSESERLADPFLLPIASFAAGVAELSKLNESRKQLEALRAAGYKLRITIEATAPCAISGASAEGETVEEAVKRLGVKLESIKTKEHA